MNIIEKAIAIQANLDIVTPGERLTIEPRFLFITGKNAMNVIREFIELGYKKVLNPSRAIFTSETDTPFSELSKMKNFCDEHGVSLLEKGEIYTIDAMDGKYSNLQGYVVAGIDSFIGRFGAQGAIPLLVTLRAMADCLGTGKVELAVPEMVYIEVDGALNAGVTAEKMCSYLLDYFNDSLAGYGIIIGGKTVEQLDETGRRVLARFIYESGATLGIISSGGPFGQVESVMKIDARSI
ncbi:aconitase family protein [Peribacillus glennii]|uniref:aconitate hydratase n=1 Tax=Peribacillus glennii TaxID=2303991 RepID=A0A372LGP4_9BACI|nr:aconitase family protein [Peribacillus glennii]RFU65249.1 hypothetical protein D0466_04930 [Peribacillus glennii]